MTYQNANGNEFRFTRSFEGVITNLERRYRETNSDYIREKISEFMSDRPCPTCKGKRLNPAALAVTVDDVNIVDANSWPVLKTLEWVKKIAGKNSPLTSKQKTIAERVIKEISERLTFSGQCRSGLSDFESFCYDLIGRRSATHPFGDAGWLKVGRCVVCAG